jgi:hypothetical protein
MRSLGMWKLALSALLIAVLALAMACGDDDDSDEVSVCDQKVEVEDSVRALTDPNLITSGTDEINAAVENVRTDLSGLREVVSADIEPEVEAMQTAVDDARDTLSEIDDESSLNEQIDAIQEAVTGIVNAAGGLTTALDEEC